MEATATIKTATVRESLFSIDKPTNPIIARLKNSIGVKKDLFVSGYSRMHNRHNRS